MSDRPYFDLALTLARIAAARALTAEPQREHTVITVRCPHCREEEPYHYRPEPMDLPSLIGLDDEQACWERARMDEHRAIDRDRFIEWAEADLAANHPCRGEESWGGRL